MANITNKEYIDYAGLSYYDQKAKARMQAADEKVLSDSKDYADSLAVNYDAAGTAQTKVDELANGQVKTNTEAIAVLNGEDTVEGSVKKQIADAKAEIEQKITDSTYDDTELANRVTANEEAITTLNGEGEGSVKKQIDDAFNDFATKISDDNVVNTYKELVDYVAEHGSETATMVGDIAKNKETIEALDTYVGDIPEDSSATNVIDYINEKVTVTGDDVSDLEDRVEELESVKYEPITNEQIDALFGELDGGGL